jgi:outer membrane immunogenic protein
MRTSITAAAIAAIAGSSAFAADLPMPPLEPAASTYSWSGFYTGGNLGGLSTSSTSTVIGGGQIGFNWQYGWLVFGGETDIQGMAFRRSAVLTNAIGTSVTANTSANYLGTVRNRIGVARGRWLAYATGGLAYTTINHNGAGVTGTYSGSDSKFGYAVGGGVEWAFLDRWSAKAEYLHSQLAKPTCTRPPRRQLGSLTAT